jgi:CRP-like cAMP-binding protein
MAVEESPVVTRSVLFESVDPADIAALVDAATPRDFPRGAVVCQRGDHADGLYLIVSGEFRIVLEGDDGRDVTLAILGRGDVMGDLSMLDGQPRSATAIARTPVHALHVSQAAFESWLEGRPRALRAIARGLARRVRVNTEQIADLGLFDVETRLHRFLWQAFVREAGGGEPFDGQAISMNQSDAASSIGASRESVNRELGQLRHEGVVHVEGRTIVLRDPARLRALVRTP